MLGETLPLSPTTADPVWTDSKPTAKNLAEEFNARSCLQSFKTAVTVSVSGYAGYK